MSVKRIFLTANAPQKAECLLFAQHFASIHQVKYSKNEIMSFSFLKRRVGQKWSKKLVVFIRSLPRVVPEPTRRVEASLL